MKASQLFFFFFKLEPLAFGVILRLLLSVSETVNDALTDQIIER